MAGVQCNALPDRHIDLHRRRARRAIHLHQRPMAGVGKVGHRPRHARGKVVLIGLAPAPDRRLVRSMLLPIRPDHRILRVATAQLVAALAPEGMRLAMRLPIDVASAPAAPVRPPIGIQAVVDQPQKRWRVPLHDVRHARIDLAQRPLRCGCSRPATRWSLVSGRPPRPCCSRRRC